MPHHYRPPGNINHYKGLVAQGFQPLKFELLWGKHRGSSEVAIRPILGARIWGSLAAPGRARGLGPTFAQRDTTTVFRPLKIFGRVLKTSNQPVRFSNVRFTSNSRHTRASRARAAPLRFHHRHTTCWAPFAWHNQSTTWPTGARLPQAIMHEGMAECVSCVATQNGNQERRSETSDR